MLVLYDMFAQISGCYILSKDNLLMGLAFYPWRLGSEMKLKP